MHPPPGKEKAALRGGGPLLTSNDTAKVAETLLPVNVARLTALGVAFRHRPATRDIVAACFCCGKLIIDAERPYHFLPRPEHLPGEPNGVRGRHRPLARRRGNRARPGGESEEAMSEVSFLFIRSDVDDAGLTPLEFRVLGHLQRRAGNDGLIWSSIQNISEVCGIHPRTVKKALNKLREMEVLSPTYRPGQTTLYRINAPDQWKIDPVQKTTPVKKLPRSNKSRESVQNLSWESVQKSAPKGNPLKGIHDKEIQSTSFSTENEVDGFIKALKAKGISEEKIELIRKVNDYARSHSDALLRITRYTEKIDNTLNYIGDKHLDLLFDEVKKQVESFVPRPDGDRLTLLRIAWKDQP